MKIVCENCAAKYSIADEKVKGKAFKIRCKKCGEPIVVRGDDVEPVPPPKPSAPAAQEPETSTRVSDYSGYQESGGAEQAIWHIVVDGQQQGPYTANQILEYQKAGRLNTESYVWQEGFDDWKPIRDVPELYLENNQAQPVADEEKTVMQPSPAGLFDAKEPEPVATAPVGGDDGGLFDQPADDGGGLFASDDKAGAAATSSPFESDGGGLFGQDADSKPADDVFSSTQAPAEPEGGLFSTDAGAEPSPAATEDDLFGGGAESEGDDLFGSVGEEAGPRVSADEIMTGQRSENSVLFSLSNLQALAASPQPQAPEQPRMGGAMTPSMTSVSEEASGLIDIRSLAGSLSDQKDTTGVEDLITMSGGGFAPSLGAPVLAAQKESMSLGTKIGIIVGSVAVLAVIVVLAVMVMSPDKSASDDQMKQLLEQELAKKLKEQGAVASAEAEAPKKQPEAAKQQPSVVKEEPTTSEERVAKAEPTPKASSSSSSPKGSTSSSKSSTSTKKRSSSTKSSATKRKASSELDDLLGPGIGGSTKKKPATSSKKSSSSSSTSETKAKLSRSDVQKGMNSVARRVKNCGQGKSGTITLKVVIGSSGRVVSATPTGAFAGTPIGSCAVRAVKSARFPRTSSSLTVKYPFRL